MTAALLLAIGSALLGGGLALLARRRASLLERTRTFAFAAAAGVVFFHLLPEVLPALGLRALVWVGAGFALPGLLEWGAHALGPTVLHGRGMSSHRVAAEVGFAALVFHSLVEGLTLWAALQAPGSHADLEVAIVAHHAPLTAAVALPFLALLGPRAAALRVLGIAVAGAVGVVSGSLLPAISSTPTALLLLPAMAATSGALLHVAFDEIRAQQFASPWERAADLFAFLAGAGLAAGSALLHPSDARQARFLEEILGGTYQAALLVAPWIALGLLLQWALRRRFPQARGRVEVALPADALLLTLALFGPGALLARAVGSAAAALALPTPGQPRRPELAARLPWFCVALGLSVILAQVAGPADFNPPAASAAAALVILLGAAADPGAATLLAVALCSNGVQPWLAIFALALGSALAASFRLRARGAALALLFAGAPALLYLWFADRESKPWLTPDAFQPLAFHQAVAPAAPVALAALALWALLLVWREGARGFWASLRSHQRLNS